MAQGKTPVSVIKEPIKPVSIIIPHYNGDHDIVRCYIAVMERTNYPFILTIIDDGSSHDNEGWKFLNDLATNPAKPINVNILFNEKNVGVTPNLNRGFAMYPDFDCVRMDADAEVQSIMWLNELVEFGKKHPKVGIIAPIGVDIDMVTIQTAGQWLVISPEDYAKVPSFNFEIFDMMGLNRFLITSPKEVDSCLGCCSYIKREVLDKIGGVDEKYFGWVEDNDQCISARNIGYKCFVLPNVSYCHHGHKPKRPTDERNKILENSENRFIEKWGFSLYSPVHYWEEIKKRYQGTEIMWRYNDAK